MAIDMTTKLKETNENEKKTTKAKKIIKKWKTNFPPKTFIHEMNPQNAYN